MKIGHEEEKGVPTGLVIILRSFMFGISFKVFLSIIEKLKRRHPHVFGKERASNIQQVESNWSSIKRAEQTNKEAYFLSGVPKNMPALAYAQAVQGRVARSELTADEQNEIEFGVMANIGSRVQTMLNKENIGDFLFWAVSFSRRIGVDAEQALRESSRKTVAKFNDLAKSQRDMADE